MSRWKVALSAYAGHVDTHAIIEVCIQCNVCNASLGVQRRGLK